MSLLDVRGLVVRYAADDGPVTAVRDVSFSLAPGRALGIVGESGSGKSSIAGAILDLLGPGADIQGSIVFEGRNLASLNPQQRRAMLGSRIGSVFQDPFTALNPALRVGHHIAEPLMQHRGANAMDAQRRAVELLAEMGITRPAEVARAFPHQLSGGMKQRALIAAALACEPSLLILDEPTTALDVTVKAQILDLLAALPGATHEIFLACSVLTYDDAPSQWRGSEACRSRTWGSISARSRTRAAPARSSIA